ncbi:hypothetical protein NC653_023478 [Populus alba x Populus x berolinensis]|uniref:Uncharacterized protein n=1 Tax=Populus alba x Populus x berolinensis TaxID=444605 RepID=A0AAD6MHC1_9ROSI|nr:hypothetical protein NC653_023478 [Populus alba x Populus x berolinensis]
MLLDRVLEEKILEGHTSKNTQLAQQKIEIYIYIYIYIDAFSKLTMQLEAGFFAKLVIMFLLGRYYSDQDHENYKCIIFGWIAYC